MHERLVNVTSGLKLRVPFALNRVPSTQLRGLRAGRGLHVAFTDHRSATALLFGDDGGALPNSANAIQFHVFLLPVWA